MHSANAAPAIQGLVIGEVNMDTELSKLFWMALLLPVALFSLMIYVRKQKPHLLRPIELFAAGAVTALVIRELLRLI